MDKALFFWLEKGGARPPILFGPDDFPHHKRDYLKEVLFPINDGLAGYFVGDAGNR